MSYFKVGDPEALVPCPYNNTHMVRNKRMQYHLIDCRKQHGTQEMQVCPYNAKHVHPKQEHQFHLVHCPDRTLIDREILHSMEEKYEVIKDKDRLTGSTQVPAYEVHVVAEEDWDSEACCQPFSLSNTRSFICPRPETEVTVRAPREKSKLLSDSKADAKTMPVQPTVPLQSHIQPVAGIGGASHPVMGRGQLTASALAMAIAGNEGGSSVGYQAHQNVGRGRQISRPVAGRGLAMMQSSESASRYYCGVGRGASPFIPGSTQPNPFGAPQNGYTSNGVTAGFSQVPCQRLSADSKRVGYQATATPAFDINTVNMGRGQPKPPNARELPLPTF